MATPSNAPAAEPQQQQSEAPKPAPPPQAPEAPQPPSLLDKIVSESQMEQRDAIIVRRAEFDQKQRMARMFSTSQCFTDVDKDENGAWLSQEVSIARAMVKIELGESMGFSAAESMTGIDIIKGRVAVGASLRAARMQRAGFTWPQMILTDKGCWMPLCYQNVPMLAPKTDENGVAVVVDGKPVMTQVVVKFSEVDAKLLGLFDRKASMYLKDPSSMYFARAVTRAQRRYGPGVLGVDALDTYEAQDIAAEAADRSMPSNTPPKQTVEEKISQAEANYAARQAKTPIPSHVAQEATPAKQQEAEAEPAIPESKQPIIHLDTDTLPDAFDCVEGARVQTLDGRICQVVEAGWKVTGYAKPEAKVSLPKRGKV